MPYHAQGISLPANPPYSVEGIFNVPHETEDSSEDEEEPRYTQRSWTSSRFIGKTYKIFYRVLIQRVIGDTVFLCKDREERSN